MSHKEFGYVRVSSIDQNEDRQIIALVNKGINIDDIYWKFRLNGMPFPLEAA